MHTASQALLPETTKRINQLASRPLALSAIRSEICAIDKTSVRQVGVPTLEPPPHKRALMKSGSLARELFTFDPHLSELLFSHSTVSVGRCTGCFSSLERE